MRIFQYHLGSPHWAFNETKMVSNTPLETSLYLHEKTFMCLETTTKKHTGEIQEDEIITEMSCYSKDSMVPWKSQANTQEECVSIVLHRGMLSMA